MSDARYPAGPRNEGQVTYQYRVMYGSLANGPKPWGNSSFQVGWITGDMVATALIQAREQLVPEIEIWVERRTVSAWERLD